MVVGALALESGEDARAGDVLAEAAAARSRSSNRDLAGFVAGGGLGVWTGLGERWEVRDLRRLESADSANWLEDIVTAKLLGAVSK